MKAWQGPGNEAGGCWWVYPWVTLYSMRALTSVLTYCDLCFMLILPELKGQCWGSSQVFLSQEGSSTQPSGSSRQTCTYVSCLLSQYMGRSLVTLWPKFFFLFSFALPLPFLLFFLISLRPPPLSFSLLSSSRSFIVAVEEENELDISLPTRNNFDKLSELEAHTIRHRELFLSRQIETYKIDMVR